MKRKTLGCAALAALAWALAGCGDGFIELDFTLRSAPPDNRVTISFDAITIPEAIAVGVIARPLDDGDEMDEETEVVLESKNLAILGVGPGEPNDFEVESNDAANWTFVIFGVSAGSTEVAVRIDGTLEARIPATVIPQ